MHARICKFGMAALVVLAFASACEDADTQMGPQVTTAPSPFVGRLVSVEPTAIVPEFLPTSSCRTFQPFRTRFDLSLRTEREFFLHRLGFVFRDRFGGHAFPTPALPAATTGIAGRALPLTQPTSSAVPIPGSLPFHGALVTPPRGTIGLLLNFDCGIRTPGRLLIDVETADRDGVTTVSQITVAIGD
jgi:hypothetical protein